MSQPMLKIPSSELTAIRIVCSSCATAVEFTPERAVEFTQERLAGIFERSCPNCRSGLQSPNAGKEVKRLAAALAGALNDLAKIQDTMRVEFLVPAPGR
jgi:hypothetical protein